MNDFEKFINLLFIFRKCFINKLLFLRYNKIYKYKNTKIIIIYKFIKKSYLTNLIVYETGKSNKVNSRIGSYFVFYKKS